MKTLWQIFAIARTEFRFGLRRSAPVLMTAIIGLIVCTGILLTLLATLKEFGPALNDLSPETVERIVAAGFTVEEYQQLIRTFMADWLPAGGAPLSWIFMSMALLFLPIATVSAIPADRKFDVLEMLRSTPITGSSYLAGKILGMAAIVLVTALIPFLLFLAVLEGVLLGFLHTGISMNILKFYIELSLMDGIPLLVCGSAIGVLTGVLFRTRRAALFPAFLVGISSLFIWRFAFKTPPTFFQITDMAAYYVFQNFHADASAVFLKVHGLESPGLLGEGASAAGFGQVFLMYVLILATLFALACLARLWLHWKENF